MAKKNQIKKPVNPDVKVKSSGESKNYLTGLRLKAYNKVNRKQEANEADNNIEEDLQDGE